MSAYGGYGRGGQGGGGYSTAPPTMGGAYGSLPVGGGSGFGYGNDDFSGWSNGRSAPQMQAMPSGQAAEYAMVLDEIKMEQDRIATDEYLHHAKRLLANERKRIEDGGELDYLEVDIEKNIKLSRKILVPMQRYPKFNFVGKLLGPGGKTLQGMAKNYKCHFYVQGHGSTRDQNKERELLNSGDPQYAHFAEPLHVRVETIAPVVVAYQRVASALETLAQILQPIPRPPPSPPRPIVDYSDLRPIVDYSDIVIDEEPDPEGTESKPEPDPIPTRPDPIPTVARFKGPLIRNDDPEFVFRNMLYDWNVLPADAPSFKRRNTKKVTIKDDEVAQQMNTLGHEAYPPAGSKGGGDEDEGGAGDAGGDFKDDNPGGNRGRGSFRSRGGGGRGGGGFRGGRGRGGGGYGFDSGNAGGKMMSQRGGRGRGQYSNPY